MVAIIISVSGLLPSVPSALSASVEEAMEAGQPSSFARVRDLHRIRPNGIAHGDGQLEPYGSAWRQRCLRLRKKRRTGRSEGHLRRSRTKTKLMITLALIHMFVTESNILGIPPYGSSTTYTCTCEGLQYIRAATA